MGKIGFINDVARGIKKVIKKDEPKTTTKETVIPTSNALNIAPLLKRAFMFLEDGEFDRADDICEQVLNQDPENSQAYLGKLMAELHVKKQLDLADCKIDFEYSKNYEKTIRFADDKLATELKNYLSEAKKNNIYEPKYTKAIKTAETFKDDFYSSDYRIRSIRWAIKELESISSYKDAAEKAREYEEFVRALEQRKSKGGCYVATCVYGSYDCPQVWTLRRFRDDTLGSTWYGRAFIRTYYAISPTLVKWFGNTNWFKNMWRGTLDKMVNTLNTRGVDDTPYKDKEWRK
jgi:tetratricopeptide (TPR) repeat protein